MSSATKTLISLSVSDDKLDVNVEFFPEAKTEGPMSHDQQFALVALEAVTAAAKCGADRVYQTLKALKEEYAEDEE